MSSDSLSDYFREMREEKKEYRQSRYEQVVYRLDALGIDYEEFANGHLRIGHIDYWATTGKYWNRKTNQRGGWSVDVLIEKVAALQESAEGKAT